MEIKHEYFEPEIASSEETPESGPERDVASVPKDVEDIVEGLLEAMFSISDQQSGNEDEIFPERKPKQINLETCFICEETLQPFDILKHLCNHFILELDRKYVFNQRPEGGLFSCNQCEKMFEEKFDFLDHMGILHKGVEEFVPVQYR